jgi:hypothetical protein
MRWHYNQPKWQQNATVIENKNKKKHATVVENKTIKKIPLSKMENWKGPNSNAEFFFARVYVLICHICFQAKHTSDKSFKVVSVYACMYVCAGVCIHRQLYAAPDFTHMLNRKGINLYACVRVRVRMWYTRLLY